MKLTDTHTDRPPAPAGIDKCVASFESIFSTTSSPFQKLTGFIGNGGPEWEGKAYVGFFPMIMLLLSLLALPVAIKNLSLQRIIIALFLSSILLLTFSFGAHSDFLSKLGINIAALKQFRSLGRFAWYFYYMISIFCIVLLYHIASNYFEEKKKNILALTLGVLFFISNMSEGHFFIKERSLYYLKTANIFKEEHLVAEQRNLLKEMNQLNYSAILPIPFYSVGSELYERDGIEATSTPMIFSFYCKKPFFGGLGARTSIWETKSVLDLFNGYNKQHAVTNSIGKDPVLVLRMMNEHLPVETRLVNRLKLHKKIGETSMYLASISDFSEVSPEITATTMLTSGKITDSSEVYFSETENRKPFVRTEIPEVVNLIDLPKGKYKEGDHVISFHYHYEKETQAGLDVNFVYAKKFDEGREEWLLMKPMRQVSGFYDGYLVFEMNIKVDPTTDHHVLLMGPSNGNYHISHLLLRASDSNVKYKDAKGNLFVNNFPVK